MKQMIETHPLGFFLPDSTKVLLLGSFPPPKIRWSMDFYYPNFQNDMWRILGSIFYGFKEYFIVPGKKAFDADKAKLFCQNFHIGIGDTAAEVLRLNGNASDLHLEVAKACDLEAIVQTIPECSSLVVTGKKALDTLMGQFSFDEPAIGYFSECYLAGRMFRVYRMPSTSRAYPKPLGEKAEYYRRMFQEVGVI